jgi:Domain of unknown function (DUF4260)
VPSPRILLRLEGAALAGAAAAVYLDRDYSLWLALLLILAPDLAFVGYLAGPRIGSYAYNATHTTIGPLVLGGAAFLGDWKLGIEIALIWLAHIGIDRAIGYGLKYPSDFKDTHLQRV